MKRLSLVFLLCATMSGPQSTPADLARKRIVESGVKTTLGATFPLAPADARKYKVTFDEDFSEPLSVRDEIPKADGTGRWSQRYWYGAPGWFSAHDDYSVNAVTSKSWAGDDMHRQENGVMRMMADRRPRLDPERYGDRPYIGSILTTAESFQQRYGYFEARARTTVNPGFWPAFWLWCRPDDGEIDIAEFQTTEQAHVYASTHQRNVVDPATAKFTKIPQIDKTDQVAPRGFKISDWHTYGLYWTKDDLVWLIDGEEVKRISSHVFHSPCFFILSNGQGGWSDANKISKTFPGTFDIDYVRAGAAPS